MAVCGDADGGSSVELLETRHVRDDFRAMPVKNDCNDARGIAQLMRLGWFRPVHCKSMAAQEVRALLTARKLVQSKLLDVQMSLRGLLRGFGLKVGPTTPSRFAGRIRDLVEGNATLEIIEAHRDFRRLQGAMRKQTSNKFSPEVRERAVRMVFDHQIEHASQWATITSIASKIGCKIRNR